jgi:AcrR family transcriptional regulator
MPTSCDRDPPPVAPNATAPYHHGDLRRALLDAAERLLVRQGAAALSLREVARAAGVSHNAPYRHFPDREALLAALAAAGFERLRETLVTAIAEAAGPHPMRAAGRAYLHFARENRALYLLMFGSEIRKSAHPDLMRAAASAMAVLQTAMPARDKAPAMSPRTRRLAVGAWALVHGLAHLIADSQVAEDLVADGGDAVAEEALAAYGAALGEGSGDA